MNAQQPKRDAAEQALSPVEADAQSLRAIIEDLSASIARQDTRHSEELRQFAYAVSHDLREPLRMIASYSQLLDRRYANQLDDDGREFVGFIVDAVRRMERLLGDLLAYSHLFRPLEAPSGLIDPEGVLEGVLLNIDREIRESGAKITHDPLPKINFDFARLTQLFRHLITNAINFRGADPPRIHVGASENEQEIIFSVRDNGVGIDPRYHDQIFGVFRRLQGREGTGTGIGLAICKRIVEQEGGRIWVESEVGKGATFYFTVPR